MINTITSSRLLSGLLLAFALAGTAQAQVADAGGVVKVQSAYSMADTISRLKNDVAAKGIKFFAEVDQAKLAAGAGIQINPSTLLEFGNPPLGTLFMKANPTAGLDWPVRALVYQDAQGAVWVAYTDFAYIQKRHNVPDSAMDAAAFKTAAGVIASITSAVKAN